MNQDGSVLVIRSGEEFATFMREIGLPAQVSQANNGTPMIVSGFGELRFVVFLIRAEGEPSYSVGSLVMMLNDIQLPLTFVNKWNRVHYFPKAVNGDDGSLVLEMNVVLHGVTKAYLRRCFVIWHNGVMLILDQVSKVLESTGSANSIGSDGVALQAAMASGVAGFDSVATMDISPSDVAEIKRLLAAIANGVQQMSGEQGGNLRAVVNRLESVNSRLGDTNSILREIASNTRG